MLLKVKLLHNSPKNQLSKAYKNDAGFDIRSAEDIVIKKISDLSISKEQIIFSDGSIHTRNIYEKQLIKTGIKLDPSQLSYFWIIPRSGFSSKYLFKITNSPGLIDYDYRGEVLLSVYSFFHNIPIKRGEKIAQLVPVPQMQVEISFVKELSKSSRGENGFGSTGNE